MNRERLKFAIPGLIAVALGFVFKVLYREYIYTNNIEDFGIADSSPSFFYVIGFSLLLLIQLAQYARFTIVVVTIASVLYECKQIYTYDFFDVGDVLASVIGGLMAYVIWSRLSLLK